MKQTPLFILMSVALTTGSLAYDPYRDDQHRQQATQDPDKISRPTTSALKGADIKEFRDKLNAAKSEIFKEGGVPGGAKFQAQTQDAAGNKFQAQAPLGQYSESVQKQILSKLPDTPANTPVQVDVTVDGKAVTVDAAKLAGSKMNVPSMNVQSVTPARNVPASNVARPVVAPLGGSRAQPNNVRQVPVADTKSVPAAPTIETTAPIQDVAKRVSNDSGAVVQKVQLGQIRAAEGTPVKTQTTLSKSEPAVRQESVSVNQISNEPAAVIPLGAGAPLVVTPAKNPVAGTPTVELRSTMGSLPQAIKDQIKADVPQAAKVIPETSPVAVVIAINADKTFTVVSVESASAETKVAEPKAVAAQTPEKLAVAPLVQNNNEAKAVPMGQSQPSIVMAAKLLAPLIGADPQLVTERKPVEAPAAAPAVQTPSVVVALRNGGEMVVREVSPGAKTEAPVYQVESKFSDLASELKNQISNQLAAFGAAELVSEDSPVEIQFTVSSGKMTVTQVAVKDPAHPNQAATIVLKNTGSNVNSAKGLVPAVVSVIKNAFGAKSGQFTLKDLGPGARVSASIKPSGNNAGQELSFTWSVGATAGTYDFSVMGRPLDFSDSIREAVYAKLREAVKNGETWASDALENDREVLVGFTVVETADGKEPQVTVNTVALEPGEAADELALSMGLKNGEYSVVHALNQTLVLIEPGRTAVIKVGEKKLKIKSPDGDAKVFLKQNRAPKDASALLLLSRDSLQANRGALIRLTGGDEQIFQILNDHPKAGQFLVRIDLNDPEKLILKPTTTSSEATRP